MPVVSFSVLQIVAFGGATVLALAGVWLWRRTAMRRSAGPAISPARPVFLFDNDTLIDATAEGHHLIAGRRADMSERDALLGLLTTRFPDLATAWADLSRNQHKRLLALDDPSAAVELQDIDGVIRLTLDHAETTSPTGHYDALARQALADESALLRAAVDRTPQLMWCEDDSGHITWANRAYLDICDRVAPDMDPALPVWSGRPLFPGMETPGSDDKLPLTGRQSLQIPKQQVEHWFDVTSMATASGIWRFATDASAAVRGEMAQKTFLQTLSRTFAELSVGLAIFDRKRKLTTFNPALHDLMGLPFDFLSSRPSLDMVMNRLREQRKLPEPKDYASWRDQFTALETAAADGTYIDLWELPDGQTFRVRGRPHPDGAIAFLFEDISAEVSLTRRFRTEIETSQTVLDTLPDAIAVFSQGNTLVIMNQAYQDLWRRDARTLEANYDLRAALRVWKAGSVASGAWRAIENYAVALGNRESQTEGIVLNDGRQFRCHLSPMRGGMTMIRFEAVNAMTATVQKLIAPDPVLTAINR